MNITDFIKSLLPTFGKNRVVEDARVSYDELAQNTVPAYIEAEKLFTGWKYRSNAMKDFEHTFKRIVKHDSSANMIVAISRGLQRILEQKEFMQDKIEASFETEVVAMGMSCVKVNLLRILETTTFVSDYALQFLNYAYILETAEETKDHGYVRANLSPAEVQALQAHFSDFCIAFNVLARDRKQLIKVVDDLPDVLIDIDTGSVVMGTIGEDKLDPLHMRGFAATTGNPIYHIRLAVAERQIEKWKRNKELKKALDLRCLNLQMVLDGKPDAALQKELEYTQGRAQSLSHKLAVMEEGL